MLIQKLRLQKGWSQEQLAELSGLSVRTIQRIEQGHKASAETLKSLASVFETDFSSLQAESDMNPSLPARGIANDEALALRQVRRIRGFYKHLMIYVLVIGGLCIYGLLIQPLTGRTSHAAWWPLWPAFGWGIGLLAHGLSAFETLPFLGADWEKRQVEKRLGRKL